MANAREGERDSILFAQGVVTLDFQLLDIGEPDIIEKCHWKTTQSICLKRPDTYLGVLCIRNTNRKDKMEIFTLTIDITTKTNTRVGMNNRMEDAIENPIDNDNDNKCSLAYI